MLLKGFLMRDSEITDTPAPQPAFLKTNDAAAKKARDEQTSWRVLQLLFFHGIGKSQLMARKKALEAQRVQKAKEMGMKALGLLP